MDKPKTDNAENPPAPKSESFHITEEQARFIRERAAYISRTVDIPARLQWIDDMSEMIQKAKESIRK